MACNPIKSFPHQLWQAEGDLNQINKEGLTDEDGNKLTLSTCSGLSALSVDFSAIKSRKNPGGFWGLMAKFFSCFSESMANICIEFAMESKAEDSLARMGFYSITGADDRHVHTSISYFFNKNNELAQQAKYKIANMETIQPACVSEASFRGRKCPATGQRLTKENAVLLQNTGRSTNQQIIISRDGVSRVLAEDYNRYMGAPMRITREQILNGELVQLTGNNFRLVDKGANSSYHNCSYTTWTDIPTGENTALAGVSSWR